jgi:quercetin dioxygenase-like cupin family protein
MTPEATPDRRPPRERFAGAEHVFDLRAIAGGLRAEHEPVRDGHRQMTLYHKPPVSIILFDFEAGARLTDHQADAHVTILALTGRLEVSTSAQLHRLPEGSLLVLDPGVRHDVFAPERGQMVLTVARVAGGIQHGSSSAG